MKSIYLDYNATTPLDPRVIEMMKPFINTHFGNPSSAHEYGKICKNAIHNARGQVAALLGVNPEEIVFTSGGSESNNFAIKGYAFANKKKGNHIITSQIEHPAVLEVCNFLEKKGFEVTYLPVNEDGLISLDILKNAIRSTTILITIMHANNEIGTVQPIQEIAKIAHQHDIVMHTDAAQSVGKVDVNIRELDADLVSIAGHKLYAPKGIGALYIRTGVQLEKLIHGANHECGRRAGTENVIGAVALGEACRIISKENEFQRYEKMRTLFIQKLQSFELDFIINGSVQNYLPNTLSLSFANTQASFIIEKLEDIAISAGAACHTKNCSVSSVLKAIRLPMKYAMGTIRISFGRFTTEEEIVRTVSCLGTLLQTLK